MAKPPSRKPTGSTILEVRLREVLPEDLPTLFEHQMDPLATEMAAFPARDHEAFMKHWKKILADDSVTTLTILADGRVVGNLVSWDASGERDIGYWIGREFWGRGIASRALAEFLDRETIRPLHAHVARHNVVSRRVLEKCGFIRTAGVLDPGADDDSPDLLFRLD